MKNLVFILLVFVGYSVFGQSDDTFSSFGVGGGIDIIKNTDLAASPLSYQGFGAPIGLNGLFISKKWIRRVEISFILPIITNNYPLKTNMNTQLRTWSKVVLNYQLLRSVGNNGKNYVGGSFKMDFFFREYNFLDGFGWEVENSLSLNYTRSIALNEKSFLLPQVSLPLIGYLHRKPGLTLDEGFLDDLHNGKKLDLIRYGKWNLIFNEWHAINLKLLYQYRINSHLLLLGEFGMNYYSISYPEKVNNLNFPMLWYLNYSF